MMVSLVALTGATASVVSPISSPVVVPASLLLVVIHPPAGVMRVLILPVVLVVLAWRVEVLLPSLRRLLRGSPAAFTACSLFRPSWVRKERHYSSITPRLCGSISLIT